MIGRHPDLVVLALALPIFVAADLPLVAYAGAAILWLIQAVAQVAVDRKLAGNTDARQVLALTMGTAIGRAFFSAAGVLTIGIVAGDDSGTNEAGLAAVLLVFALFTTYRAVGEVLRHAFNEGETL